MLTRDAAAYALLLRFYDGLCCWEEDSQTPVLHITWATHMLSSIGKFDSEARTSIELIDTRAEDEKVTADKSAVDKIDKTHAAVNGSVQPHNIRKRRSRVRTAPMVVRGKSEDMPSVGKCDGAGGGLGGLLVATVDYSESGGSSEVSPIGVDSQLMPPSDDLKMSLVVEQLASQSDENDDDADRSSEIDALAHACCDSLLNPDFLRGSGEPFVKDATNQLLSSATYTQMDLNEFAACTSADSLCDVSAVSAGLGDTSVGSEWRPMADITSQCRPQLTLRSAKMLALKQLLIASKLNASAIKLHLTAQSQVAPKSSHVRRPLSTQFYSEDRHHRQATKRRATD